MRYQELLQWGYGYLTVPQLFALLPTGTGEVTDCDQNSVGFCTVFVFFLFLLATQTDWSQFIIYKATGSAPFLGQGITTER